MRKVFVLVGFLLVGSVCSVASAEGATNVSGRLPGSATWTLAGSPYIVSQVEVPVGATLTIEPGVVVKLNGTIALYSFGTINIGGDGSPVVITTINDDSFGGDSNGDGNATTPSKLDWCTIGLHTNATISIKNTNIYYGGCTQVYGQLYNFGGTLMVENSLLTKSGAMGLMMASGTTTLRNTEVTSNVIGVRYHRGTFTMEGNSIHDNTEYGMVNTNTATPRVVVDARNTWWGDATGPKHLITNPTGLGNEITNNILYTPWKDCFNNCVSNVMFLPGIMGSRLYDNIGAEEELWVSSGDAKQERMEMNSDGTSKNAVYTKDDTVRGSEFGETGLVDDAYGSNLYESFLEDLRDWKTEGVYTDYAFIPYDWRLSLEDIVMNGRVDGNNLSYTTENADLTQSYLYQKAKALQTSSKSGKVTLIGHSNGGLVLKVFVQKLKDAGDPLYHQIDKVILVAVPQTGTPDAVVSMLYGSKLGVAWLGVSAERSRSLVHNMPTMYNLLPSEKLFDAINPPIEFVGNNIDPRFTDSYGDKINTHQEMQEFLGGAEGRDRPNYRDTFAPEVLRDNLLTQAEAVHQTLDTWSPAPETEVVQIAGWGLYTVSGLQVEDEKVCIFNSNQLIGGRPVCTENKDGVTVSDKFTLNGDATVLVPSALDMAESGKVKKYWVDLDEYNQDNTNIFTQGLLSKVHKNILEVDTLRSFIKSLIKNNAVDTADDYITTIEPAPLEKPYIKYELHSPLHLAVTDSAGKVTGWDSITDTVVENIKGAQYFETGEVKTVLIPKDTEHAVRLTAYAEGSFTLDIEELQEEEIISQTKFEAIPTLANSIVEVTPSTETEPVQMKIDFDADGTVETEIVVATGETAEYENPIPLDTTPPETTVSLVGTEGENGWYRSSVEVVLTSEEGATTEYALEDGSWQSYSGSFTITQENVTELRFRSTDTVGNQEVVKVQEIKIDTIAPEPKVSFDLVTEKLSIQGVEEGIGVTQSSNIYTLTDEAGNITILTFSKQKEQKNKDEAILESTRYNEGELIEFTDTRLLYRYKEDKGRDEARAFSSHIRSGENKLTAHYLRKKDKTYIMDKGEDGDDDPETCEKRKVKKIFPGLVVPYIVIDKGKINIKY
jgi:pimeloyl-ACP methyl ester carboxylesterase